MILKNRLRVKVAKILEKDYKTPKVGKNHPEGLIGFMIGTLKIGENMVIQEEDTFNTLRTTKITGIDENGDGAWVETKNTVYRLDKICQD